MKVFIVSRTCPAAGFEIVAWDEQTKVATLRGSHGTYRSTNFCPHAMRENWRLTNDTPPYLMGSSDAALDR